MASRDRYAHYGATVDAKSGAADFLHIKKRLPQKKKPPEVIRRFSNGVRFKVLTWKPEAGERIQVSGREENWSAVATPGQLALTGT